ncbi:hypothetical protein CHLRE_07g325950v5 [Chlamydomonas reinhardtii]|uniref:SPX domain-containing protein n=1 Tax=Chlamydomonas reinhardtii TaxID=3055 RepID=A0A2K3DJJ4_CHLRE|nr:uncharacterized protein CHLRE_07g325950v5 [Chlamydomonas reinhardtii]PNW80691.1 hypothetical protein CHLRE_07g325950v5 [Chlamydomonas reinhardtii]
MKFGKVLKVSSENMPGEMHDLFLRYKELKKKIKAIPVSKDPAAGEKQASVSPDGSATAGSGGSSGATITATVLSPEEQAFINTLNEDLARFNRFFIEKEEEAVIRLQALCDELSPAAKAAGVHIPEALTCTVDTEHDEPLTGGTMIQQQQQQQAKEEAVSGSSPESEVEALPSSSHQHAHGHGHGHGAAGASPAAALQAVKSRLVQFHGEMVLLLHWSLLNYAAVVKILKKHDKRTGVLLRAPYLANVLQQPFSSTAIMSKLAKRAEELVVATTHAMPLHAAAATAVAAAAAAGAAAPGGRAATAAAAAPSAGQETHVTSAPAAERGAAEAGGAAPGPSTASASEASSLTFAAAGQAAAGRAPGSSEPTPGLAEPLVGSTMHALETWANLRKNAITPSTVVAAEDVGKRKASEMEEEAAAAAGAPAAKVGKTNQ